MSNQYIYDLRTNLYEATGTLHSFTSRRHYSSRRYQLYNKRHQRRHKRYVEPSVVDIYREEPELITLFASCFKTLFVPDKTSTQPTKKDTSTQNVVISSEPRQERPTELFDLSHKHEYTTQRSFSPDASLERLLDRSDLHVRPDEVSKRYLKIKAKYITDGQGVVSGILLVTPQTLMFNPDVSDHLVMDRGSETYVVRAPLKSISSVVFYDDIAAMVTGDEERIYNPSTSFIDYDRSLSPKPGVICQETGEKFHLFSPEHEDKLDDTCSHVSESQIANESSAIIKSISTDQGISSMSETQSSETTLKDDTVLSDNNFQYKEKNQKEPEKISLFMQETKLSSTPKHTHKNDNIHELDCPSIPEDNDLQTQSISSAFQTCNTLSNSTNITQEETLNEIENLNISSPESFEQPSLDSTRLKNDNDKDEVLCKNNSSINTTSEPLINETENSLSDDKNSNDKNSLDNETLPAVKNAGNSSAFSPTGDLSKDSGISELTHSHSMHQDSHENVSHEHIATKSSLSSEARQWLGKRGIKLTSMEEEDEDISNHSSSTDDISMDVAPRPASKIDDPLMYAAIKIHRSYWFPSRTKNNSIMGIPPNRDQKRRQHWFAIPKERVDQMNTFLLQWAPDVNALNSGLSTPASEDLLERSEDEGIEFVEDRFNTSPATSYGFQKVLYDDVPPSLKKVESIHSVSSRSSLRSLYEDEPMLLADSSLLTRKQLGQLSRKLPSRTVGHSLELVYSTTLHGFSLTTLYRNFNDYDASALILCKDEHDRVFGAFISESPKVSEGFYGTGESLLFSFTKENKVKTSKITVDGKVFQKYSWRDPENMHGDLQIYRWSGENNFFIKGSKSSFCIGGGEGVFGLWLDGDLYRGRSHSCKTFDNATLSEKEDFICTGLEAWAFV